MSPPATPTDSGGHEASSAGELSTPQASPPALPVPEGWPQSGDQWRHSDNLTDAEWGLVEDYAIRFGDQYDSYLSVRAEGRRFFFASEGRGIVSGIQRGRRFGTFGGILGPVVEWDSVAQELVAQCKAQKMQVGFFAANQALREHLEPHGFRANKFGESAIVNLNVTDWKGKNYEWIRRQSNFCLRQGLKVQEHPDSERHSEQWDGVVQELLEIEHLFLSDRSHGGKLRHVVGEFCGKLHRGQRLFTARNENTNQIEGFVVSNPSLDGKRWVLECFRRRPDASRGVITFLLHQIMQKFQTEGVEEADLCMVPFVNCDAPIKNDHWLSRKSLSFLGKRMNWIYDSQGLYHFKSRFRPEFRDLFVCVHPGINIGWIHYLIAECGFLNIRPTNVARQIMQHFFKRKDRANMASQKPNAD